MFSQLAEAFRRHESVDDYEDVWIPLNQAHNYSHSAREGRSEYNEKDYVVDEDIERRLNQDDGDDNGDDVEAGTSKEAEGDADADEQDEARGMLQGESQGKADEYSVEGLRAAMTKGQGSGPHGRFTSAESELPSQDVTRRAWANMLTTGWRV